MTKVNKARKYKSSKLEALLEEVSPIEMEQSKTKMQIAARIEDFMNAKGWNKTTFAEKFDKNPSEITKWLSGTQNFTVDVLTEIASVLGVEIIDLFGRKQIQVVYRKEFVVKSSGASTAIKLTTPYINELAILGTCFYTNKDFKSGNLPLYQA